MGMVDKEPLLDVAQETAWHFAVKIPQIPYKPMQDVGPCLDRLDWLWDILHLSGLAFGAIGKSEVLDGVDGWTDSRKILLCFLLESRGA